MNTPRTPAGTASMAAATAHEAYAQRGALPAAIRSLRAGVAVRGPAFTVLCGPADTLALHHAIAAAPAGSVIVCHTGGHYDAGYLGDIMVTAAEARRVAGFVIDGCVRDFADIARGPVAVFARGLSVKGTTKDPRLPMLLQPRLRIGGVDIDPGDLIVGDDDGVVAVSSAHVADVAARSVDREARETEIRRRLRGGELTIDVYGLPAMPHASGPDPL
jgi:4-hydroxy-4-methyl-2-oxoglutarate aldolase